MRQSGLGALALLLLTAGFLSNPGPCCVGPQLPSTPDLLASDCCSQAGGEPCPATLRSPLTTDPALSLTVGPAATADASGATETSLPDRPAVLSIASGARLRFGPPLHLLHGQFLI